MNRFMVDFSKASCFIYDPFILSSISNRSIRLFLDETFQIKHDKRGIVGMANNGRHTNGSQFYITLQPAPWMDKKFVALG